MAQAAMTIWHRRSREVMAPAAKALWRGVAETPWYRPAKVIWHKSSGCAIIPAAKAIWGIIKRHKGRHS